MKIFEEKKKENKEVTCPLDPMSTRWQKLEIIQSLSSEPPRQKGGKLNRKNPRA